MHDEDGPTYQTTALGSLWDNVVDGASVGAGAGALFGGVGAIPGALGGGLLGLGKSVIQKIDQNDDREDYIREIQRAGGGDLAASRDPDIAQAREEVFYENREKNRQDTWLPDFFENWIY